MAENTTRQGTAQPVSEQLLVCPICTLPAGRLIRGKLYCGNCGFIES